MFTICVYETQLYTSIWILNLSIAIHILFLATSPQNLFWNSSRSHFDTLAVLTFSNLSPFSSVHTSVLIIITWLPSLFLVSSFRAHTLILFGWLLHCISSNSNNCYLPSMPVMSALLFALALCIIRQAFALLVSCFYLHCNSFGIFLLLFFGFRWGGFVGFWRFSCE